MYSTLEAASTVLRNEVMENTLKITRLLEYSRSSSSPTFICNLESSTHIVFVVTCGHAQGSKKFECLGAHVPAEAEDTAVGLVWCGGGQGMEAGRAPTVRASGSGSGAGWWESHSGTCFVGRPQTTRHSALLNTASSVVKLEKKKKRIYQDELFV